MKNRWTVAAVTLASAGCLGLFVLALLPASPGVTRTNFNRIEQGMTQTEAEAILGGSPHDMSPNGRDWSDLRHS